MFARPQMYLLAAGGVVGLSVLAVVYQPVIVRQMNEWQLLPRPERVTELYFSDPQDASEPSAEPAQTVTFTVHNSEHRTTRYHYKLIDQAEGGDKERVLETGSFTLPHGRSLTTSKNIVLAVSTECRSVKVDLQYEAIVTGATVPTGQEQSIHYWLDGEVREDA